MLLIEIIQGTPYWVWAVLAYLLFIGIKALRSNNLPLWQLSIMPLVFTTWAYYSLYAQCYNCWSLYLLFACFYGLGHVLAPLFMSNKGVTVDHDTWLVHIPGGLGVLILSLSFFAVKYVLGVTMALSPEWQTFLFKIDVAASAFIAGASWNRFNVAMGKLRYAQKRS